MKVKRGHRFLASTLGNLAASAAGRRILGRREGRRPDPEAAEPIGSIHGEVEMIGGPRSSRIYTERFAGKSPLGTLVFTHGWCLTESVWHYQKRDLAGDDLSLVTWDLPGHGHSSPVSAEHLSLDLAADSLARVVEEHADGNIILVGHSLGGVVTLAYLARHAETCRRVVRGAVLVSTPLMHFAHSVAGGWPGAGLEARALGRMMEAAVESSLAERVLTSDVGRPEINRLSYRVTRIGFGRGASPSHVRFIRDTIASVAPEVRADTYRAMTGHDLRPLLPTIRTPTLVLIGSRDRLVNPEESKALAVRLPRGRSVELPDAGHASFMEAHHAFNAHVRDFSGKRLAGTARAAE